MPYSELTLYERLIDIEKKEQEDPERERFLHIRRMWEQNGVRYMLIQQVWSERTKLMASMLYDYYCGYCNLDIQLPRDFAEDHIDVHGGITLQRDEQDGTTTYGFDCAHLDDENRPELLNEDFLAAMCEEMAAQIISFKDYALPQGE